MTYANIIVGSGSNGSIQNGSGTQYLVRRPSNGHLYLFTADQFNGDILAFKSVDGGLTWQQPIVVAAIACAQLAVWYDRWSGIDADLVHLAYSDSGADDCLYRSLDLSSDSLGTQTTIFAGASTTTLSHLSITRARGGNLYAKVCIDNGIEGGFFRSTDVGGTWGSRTLNEALASQDQMILLPGFAADDQDIIGIFWDASADEISRQLYDDSADTWAETSIATSMVDRANTSDFPHFAASVDLENSQIVLAAWSGADTANADLRCWTVTESAITEVTNVVQNSTDDQGLCALGIDTDRGYWYVAYCGKSDGSETWNTAVNVYFKVSTDGGSTWGPETITTANLGVQEIHSLFCCPRFVGQFNPYFWAPHATYDDQIFVCVDTPKHAPTYQLIGG